LIPALKSYMMISEIYTMRINKYIAESGVASRRSADELIKQGRVSVNGKKITECGLDVNTDNDVVFVDGRKITPVRRYTYIMFNKPKGCITTSSDEFGRKTIYDYLAQYAGKGLFPVGRLDYDSEGLLLLTNDGALAQILTHPSFEVPKTYLVKIEGTVSEDELKKIRAGVKGTDGVRYAPAKVSIKEVAEPFTKLEITITEGKNREVRKIFEAIGKNVVFLCRRKIGDLSLGGLTRGTSRYLTEKEITYLKSFGK